MASKSTMQAGVIIRLTNFCLIIFCSSLTFAQANAAKCKAPAELERRIAAHPSALAYDEMGAYFGQLNNFSCAIPAFQSSIKINPKSSATRYYLALALLAVGDPAGAAREAKVSLQLKPDNSKVHMTLGAALAQMNQLDAAIEQFNLVLKSDPKSVTALDWLSKALLSQERYPAAIAMLKNAPPDEVLKMDLVIAYSKSGHNDDALHLLTQMIKDYPQSAVAHAGLATIYVQLNRMEEAGKEYQEAIRLDPKDDFSRISYAKALTLSANFKDALPIVQDYRQRHPDDFEGLYLLGIIDRRLGNNNEAREILARAVLLNPEHYDTQYNLGVVLMATGDNAGARIHLEKAVQLDPTSQEARFQLATALRSLGLRDEARQQLELYQRSIQERAKKDISATKANQGNEYLQNGDLQKAIDNYREAIAANPNNSHMMYNLALALDRKGNFAEEKEVLQKAIAVDPHYAAPHNQIGFLNFQAGQMADAETEFETAISLDQHYAEAQNNLGSLYGQQGKDADAEKLFREAIENNPAYAQAYVNLAVTLASQSRFNEAESALQSALQIEPGNEQAQEVMAKIRAEKNTGQQAR